jgi:hypothetical protein
MVLSPANYDRVLSRYRIIFRVTAAVFAVSVLLALAGVHKAISLSDIDPLASAALLAILCVLFAYKIVLSTMHVLEKAADEHGWDLSQ